MAGFTLPDLGYNVEFTGHKLLDGLVVKVRSVSVDELIELSGRADLASGSDIDPKVMGDLLDMVAGLIVGWNLEAGDGTPIPADRAQLGRLDLSVLLPILNGVIGALSGALKDSDLGKGSPSGEPSEDLASLPTEALSASLGS
jgi:hypothetical protein